MKRRITPILIGMHLSGMLLAQQIPQYSMYMLNPYAWNPAAAGTENTLMLTGVYRQQWAGLEGAPVGQHVNAHLPVYLLSSGVGIKVDNDAIGAHHTTQAVLSYAYQLEIGRSSLLALGLSGGYMQYTLDGAKLRAPDGMYDEAAGIFVHNDGTLPENKVSAGTPVFEAGVYFQTGELRLGASVQPVFAPEIKAGPAGQLRLVPAQQYIFSGNFGLQMGQEWEFTPGFLAKTDFFITQLELSANFQWRQNIFAGVSYRGYTARSKDAAVLMAGWRVNEKTMIAYAYDLPVSSLRTVNRGSHELLLRYSLNKPIGKGKLPPVIYNPRYW